MASQKFTLRELFDMAFGLPEDERARFLDTHCADAAERHHLERMLAYDTNPAGTLPKVPASALANALSDADVIPALPPGSRIGPFELIAVLGEGGSSTVFHAARTSDGVRQDVALKLLRRGLYSDEARRQFRRERLALAQLQHPGIARLIEGGVTETGVAYIALELVKGEPITQYARDHRLDMRARLLLFLDVCRAVDAAHRALIVHRDLKPSNVLITTDGSVKLLDFGIAKLLSADDDTHTQMPAFTPAYASPEQRAAGLITTATDVYGLGVLLGELMTGERLSSASTQTLSSSVSDEHVAGVLPAAPATTRRQLRGDLDNIVLKALNIDPAMRYASAGMFAEEIKRLLDGRPVAAHPPSGWYRARKFFSRHRGGVATTVAFLLAILAALTIALWQAVVARDQAQIAREQAERADATRRFLVGVFDQAEPDANLGKSITARQLLEQGEHELLSAPDDNSGTYLDLTVLIGHLYWDLGDYAHAEPLLKQALASAIDPHVSDEVKARTLMTVAKFESEKRKFDDALDHAKQAIVIAERAGRAGVDSASEARRIVAESLHGQDNSKDAEPIMRAALDRDREIYGDRSQAVADDWTELGSELTELSRFDEAIVALRNAVDLTRSLHGSLHSSVANALQELGGPMGYAGDYAGAERVQSEALGIYEKVYGNEHHETLIAAGNLYWVIEHQGRYEEALQGRLQTMKVLEKVSTTRPEAIANAFNSIGYDYFQLGRFDEAETNIRQSLATWKTLQGSNDEWDSADPLGTLATVLLWRGRYAEAESAMRKAISIEHTHELPSSGWLNRDRADLGDILRHEHRYREALQEIIAAQRARMGAQSDPLLCALLTNLSQAQLDTGDASSAQSTALQSLVMARQVFPPMHLNLGTPLFALARADLALGHADEAEPLLREALAVRSPPYPADDPRVLEIKVALVNVFDSLNRAGEARVLRSEIDPALNASTTEYFADLRARLASTGSATGKSEHH